MGFQNLVLAFFMIALVVGQYGDCRGISNHSPRKKLHGGFVQRNGTHFFLNGKPHYINGFNSYWLTYVASDPSTMSKVTTTFQDASQLYGLNVARTWAFNDGASYRALQTSPGSYDESVFKALDFVVSEAGKYGVKLILSFVNNWKNFGGKYQYVQWARERGQFVISDDDFFTNPIIKQYYKNHVKAVLTRKNTITGLTYKDDPTIFAWELINEPRSVSDNSGKTIQDWVSEMAVYVKYIDPYHLLEVGLEGFYGESMPEKKQFNPGYQVGTDFITNNQVPQIDFATIHLYAETWEPVNSTEARRNAFIEEWVQAHIEDSNNVLKKPILITEFGMSSKYPEYTVDMRNNYFQKMYNFIYNSASNGGACAGGLFWQVMGPGIDGLGEGCEVILEEVPPSTACVITQQSQRMANIKIA